MSSSQLVRVQEFIQKYSKEVSPLPVDPVALLLAWDSQYNDLDELVRNEHLGILDGERQDLVRYPTERAYYTEAVARYAVDQDTESLEAAATILEENLRDNTLEDLFKVCAEVLRQEVKPTVVPDDGP